MDTNEYEEIAYAMTEAYENNLTMKGDIEEVLEQFPHANKEILRAMWLAISVYRDLNR